MAVRGGVSYDLHARMLFAARFIIRMKVLTVSFCFSKSPVDIVKFLPCRLAYMYQCFGGYYCLHLRSGSRRRQKQYVILNAGTHMPGDDKIQGFWSLGLLIIFYRNDW